MPRPSTNPTKVAAALADLQRRVERGQEFPDAQWSAASQHNVDHQTLADAYDEADLEREQQRREHGHAAKPVAQFARKPHDHHDLETFTSPAQYTVVEHRAMSTAEYDAFASDFYAAREWLKGKGGYSDSGAVKAIEVTAPERPTLLVNPEGYDYAKYVAHKPA